MKIKRKTIYLILFSLISVFSVIALFMLPYKLLFALILSFSLLAIIFLYLFTGNRSSPGILNRKNFSNILIEEELNRLFDDKKPFLNVNYKISDLEKQLKVNRSAIKEYTKRRFNRNFNQYINLWRIAELNRLRKLPENWDVSVNKLCLKAGFSSAQQFHLAERERKKINKGKNKIKTVTKPIENDPIEDPGFTKKPQIQMRI